MDFKQLEHFKTFYFQNHEEEQFKDFLKFDLYKTAKSNILYCKLEVKRHYFFFIDVLRIAKDILSSQNIEQERSAFLRQISEKLSCLSLIESLNLDCENNSTVQKFFGPDPINQDNLLEIIRSLSMIKNEFATCEELQKTIIFGETKEDDYFSMVKLAYETRNLIFLSSNSLVIGFIPGNNELLAFGRVYYPITEEEYFTPQAKFCAQELVSNISEY